MQEGRVELEAVARVEAAIRDFERLESQIRDVLDLAARGPGAIQIGVDVDAVRAQLREIKDAIEAVRAAGVEISTDKAVQQLDRLEKKIERLDDEAGVVTIDADAEPALDELKKLRQRYRRELERLQDETRRADPLDGLSEEVAREALEMVRELRQLERRFDAAVDRLNRAAKRTDFDPASRSARNLREQVRVAALEIVEFSNHAGPSLRQTGGDFDFVEEKAEQAAKAVDRYTREIREAGDARAGNRLTGSLRELTAAVRGLIALELLQWLQRVGAALIEASRASDLARVRLANLFDDADGVEAQMRSLAETAEIWGLSLEFVREKAPGLMIALEQLGVPLDEQRLLIEGLLVAARGAGASVEQTRLILKAFTDLASKGTVSLEELNGQLSESLPGATAILAKALGLSVAELRKMIESGEVLSSEVLPTLVYALTQEFGPGAIAAAEGTDAAFTRVENTLTRLGDVISEDIRQNLIDFLSEITGSGDDVEQVGRRIADAINLVLDVATDLTAGARRGIAVGREWAAEFSALFYDFASAVNDAYAVVLDTFGRDELAETIRRQAETTRLIAESYREVAEEARRSGRQREDAEGRAQRALERTQAGLRELVDVSEAVRDRQAAISDSITADQEALRERLADLAKLSTDDQVAELERLKAEHARIQEALEAQTEKRADAEDRLSDRQVKALEAVQKVLKAQIGEAERAAQKDLRALERRQRAWERFGASLSKLFDTIARDEERSLARRADAETRARRGPVAGPSSSTRTDPGVDRMVQQLGDLRRELAELERQRDALASATLLDPQQLVDASTIADRIDHVRAQIRQLETDLSLDIALDLDFEERPADRIDEELRAAEDVARQRGEALRAALRELVSGDDFAEAFRALPEASQDAVRQVIESLDQAAPHLSDFRGRVASDLSEIARILEASGEAPRGFAEAFRQSIASITGESESLQQTFDRLQGQVVDAADRVAGSRVRLEEGADGWRIVQEQADAAAEGAESAGQRVGDAAERAADTAVQMKEGAEGWEVWNEAAQGAAEGAEAASDAADGASESGRSVGEGLRAGAEGARELTETLEPTLDGLGRLVEIVQSLDASEGAGLAALVEGASSLAGQAETLPVVAESLRSVSESVVTLAEQAEPIASGLAAISEHLADPEKAEALRVSAEAWSALREQLSGAAGDLETIATRLERYAESAEPVDEASTTIRDALARLSERGLLDALREQADTLERLAEGVDQTATNTEALNPQVEQLVANFETWQRGTEAVADIVDQRLLPSMQKLEERTDSTVGKIDQLGDSSIRAAQGVAQLRQQIDGIQQSAAVLEGTLDRILVKLDQVASKADANL